MLIVRATKKLAQRLGGFGPAPTEPDLPMLGEWYATVIFWRPQVPLFVSETTLLPVFVPLAPATSVIRRLPAELADVLRRQEVPGAFVDRELSKMDEAICLPTASRSMLGVLNEYVHLANHVHAQEGEPPDLAWLEDWLAQTPMGPLHGRHGSPGRELAALIAGSASGTAASHPPMIGVIPSMKIPRSQHAPPTERVISDHEWHRDRQPFS